MAKKQLPGKRPAAPDEAPQNDYRFFKENPGKRFRLRRPFAAEFEIIRSRAPPGADWLDRAMILIGRLSWKDVTMATVILSSDYIAQMPDNWDDIDQADTAEIMEDVLVRGGVFKLRNYLGAQRAGGPANGIVWDF